MQHSIFFPTLSLILTITILSFSPPPFAAAQHWNCNGPFNCGNITGLGYPFWGPTRRDYCGHPKFELNCTSDTAVISIENLTYQVLDVNTQSKRMTVARTDYIGDICPQNPANTTLDTEYFNYGSDIQMISMFYDCPSQSPGMPGSSITQFSCNNETGFYLTGNVSEESSNWTSYFGTCGTMVTVPANLTAVKDLERSLSEENLIVAFEQGFDLTYTVNESCGTCELSGGVCGSNLNNSDVFACYCPGGPQPFSCGGSTALPPPSTGSKSKKLFLKIGVPVASFTAISIVCACYFYYRRRRGFWKGQIMTRQEDKIEAFILNNHTLMPRRFSYSQMKKMTSSFRDKLGQGGFAQVFKGTLPNGQSVAVKMLVKSTSDGEEFVNEVASISRTSHVNIVNLLGFCYEGTKRALIYEYMPNGSLDKFLCNQGFQHTNRRLDFQILYNIATGTARGLEYLHRGCNTRIVHFDIKPHNILLDEDFCPKISDFGLAKLCKERESVMSTFGARGTVGYIAPEVFIRSFGAISYKSDVYSYGMMILEMFGGKSNVDIGVPHTTERYFPDSVYEYLESGTVSLLHTDITYEEEEMLRRMLIVGFWCIQPKPSDRPSMSKVLEMLEGNLESLQTPPKPSLFLTNRMESVGEFSDPLANFSASSLTNCENPEALSAVSQTPYDCSKIDEEKLVVTN